MPVEHIIFYPEEEGVALDCVLDQHAPSIHHHQRKIVLLKKAANFLNQSLFANGKIVLRMDQPVLTLFLGGLPQQVKIVALLLCYDAAKGLA